MKIIKYIFFRDNAFHIFLFLLQDYIIYSCPRFFLVAIQRFSKIGWYVSQCKLYVYKGSVRDLTVLKCCLNRGTNATKIRRTKIFLQSNWISLSSPLQFFSFLIYLYNKIYTIRIKYLITTYELCYLWMNPLFFLPLCFNSLIYGRMSL